MRSTTLSFVFAALAVCLAAPATAAMLSVDLQDDAVGGTVTEDGFVTVGAAGDAGVGVTLSTSEVGLNITIGATGGGFLAPRGGIGSDRGGDLSNLSQGDLHGDVIAARNGDGGFLIEITGLDVGLETVLTAFHNEANGGNSGFATPGALVTPSIDAGATLISAVDGAHTNFSRPGSATFSGPYDDSQLVPSVITFTPTSSTVTILLSSAAGNNFNPVSGIIVDQIPEPTTFALFGLGALCLMAGRRR